jgi:hypothetical protein
MELGGTKTANESEIKSMDNTTPTLKQFIQLRLGKQTSEINMLKEMLVRSFGADSFHEFWRYWNPVYGYYLHYKCYKPLQKYFPRYMCVILTFAASGFFYMIYHLDGGYYLYVSFRQGISQSHL